MTDSTGAGTRAAARERYYERLGSEHLAPLWEFFKDWFTGAPQVDSQPFLWSYEALRPLMLESAEIVDPKEAERRVLALENPGLEGRRLITESLYAGLQLLMPGEVAPCHRHSPAALRFVMEGQGAFTSVDGEKAYMEPGDLIVTPSWAWHEHGHEGSGPTVWLDVLDVPLIHKLNAIFTELLPGKTYPDNPRPLDSSYRYGMNMLPVSHARTGGASRVFSYPYARSREALERLKTCGEPDECHGLKMAYIDPSSGEAAIPTISTFLQLLEAGFSTRPYRTTAGTIYCIVEGAGSVTVGADESARELKYKARDVFVVPSWTTFRLHASDESVLFSASDEVVQRKLGVWRETRSIAG